jgi:hypothetical protein
MKIEKVLKVLPDYADPDGKYVIRKVEAHVEYLGKHFDIQVQTSQKIDVVTLAEGSEYDDASVQQDTRTGQNGTVYKSLKIKGKSYGGGGGNRYQKYAPQKFKDQITAEQFKALIKFATDLTIQAAGKFDAAVFDPILGNANVAVDINTICPTKSEPPKNVGEFPKVPPQEEIGF